MNHYVQTYGKQLIKELMDAMLIKGYLTDEEARELLIKHNLISKRTKIIHTSFYVDYSYKRINGMYTRTDERIYKLNIKNGRGQSVLYFTFNDSQIQELLEDINDETERDNE